MRAALSVTIVTMAALGGGVAAHAEQARQGFTCQRGEFCVWTSEQYQDAITRVDLRKANPDECFPLPEGFRGRSFVNRTSRSVTVYQGRDCSTEGDFSTYPGEGTYVPAAPYLARAVKIWN